MAERAKYTVMEVKGGYAGKCRRCGYETPTRRHDDDAAELAIEHSYECAE